MAKAKRSDLKLYEQAVKNRWPISDTLKKEVIGEVRAVLKEGDDRGKVAAARVIVAMERQNQIEEHQQERHDRADGRSRVTELIRELIAKRGAVPPPPPIFVNGTDVGGGDRPPAEEAAAGGGTVNPATTGAGSGETPPPGA